ncbi:helix-turn-helix transcriptional regulator [Actinoplanes sp. NPDC049118]|uniref:PadR family transcriptional regulator n=1 Tax=Actinoplanes sp. NPDC049118 TaxID=3155769 RepID=UPI003410D9F7
MGKVQITVAVARVLREFLAEPSEPRYGYELMHATSFPSGKLYPILKRLMVVGWLIKEREPTAAPEVGRPIRSYYRLTPDGTEAARYALAELSEQISPPLLGSLRPNGGLA